jgi:hypothetical protein
VAAPERPLRAGEILKELVRGRVEFVVVGGIAVQTHGYIRGTRDVDVVPSPSPTNRKRLSKVLSALAADEVGRDAHLVRFNTRDGRLGVLRLVETAPLGGCGQLLEHGPTRHRAEQGIDFLDDGSERGLRVQPRAAQAPPLGPLPRAHPPPPPPAGRPPPAGTR